MMQKPRLCNTQTQNEGYGGMCKGVGVLVVAVGMWWRGCICTLSTQVISNACWSLRTTINTQLHGKK